MISALTLSGIINKVLDIAGDILDPGKKKELEIALLDKKMEFEKIIIENETQKEVAKQKTLSALFEKGGFPALLWLFCGYGWADILQKLWYGQPISPNEPLTEFIKIAFLAVLGKQGALDINYQIQETKRKHSDNTTNKNC